MRGAHTVEQVRAAEAALMARLPDGALMQRAATGLAHAVVELLGTAYGRRVVLLVGPGDNGGDALHAGALLARRGCAVGALLLADRAHESGLAALRAAGGRVLEEPTAADVVVDGIVGIGARPGLRDAAAAALAALDGIPVVAVDVPSGVEVDTGRAPAEHVTADLTVTFGTHKVAHLVGPAAEACGAVHLVDLGLDLPPAPVEALQAADVAGLVRCPGPTDHKYTRGVVGVRAGSAQYPGAALLCVAGAGSGLTGMVRYAGPAAVADRVRAAHPEVVGPGRVQAWVVGSGGGDAAGDALEESLADRVPVVVDADALPHVTTPLAVPAVLTPHAGELGRMLGRERSEVEADRLASAREAADRFGAVVVLKGHRTLVAEPGGRVRAQPGATPWLATAGAGDVLAGLVGALLASGSGPFDAASAGVWLHAAAAATASRGGPIVAGDVAAAIPDAVRALPPVR